MRLTLMGLLFFQCSPVNGPLAFCLEQVDAGLSVDLLVLDHLA